VVARVDGRRDQRRRLRVGARDGEEVGPCLVSKPRPKGKTYP
jgi:hypothetical protein